MPAAVHNFLIEQGSDFEITFQYLNDAGAPVNLTNYCGLLRFRTNTGAIFSFSTQATPKVGYIFTTDSNGNLNFRLPYTTTINYKFDSAVYDLEITEPPSLTGQSKKFRLSTGTITIVKNNFSECPDTNLPWCADCSTLSGDPQNSIPSTGTGPSPTPTGTGILPTPTPLPEEDLCATICGDLDLYAVFYSGIPISIYDNSLSSGSINISNTGIMENIEVSIQGLRHTNPQDLAFILAPPNGNKILLSAHNKISNYKNGFSYIVSNKAASGIYINNVNHNGYVNILDKRSIYNFDNESLEAGLDHLFGTSPSGQWTLYVKDDDILSSGSLDRWNLIVTYYPPEVAEEYVTPTPTPTITSTPTLTPTPSLTATVTITPTQSLTQTPTETPTPTPTITPTESLTPTPTITVSVTPTETPTVTPTPTLTPTITVSPSVTPTLTSTPTITPTASPILLPFAMGANTANANACADWNFIDGNVTTVGTNGGPSAYGAYDMAGNVREWNDAIVASFSKGIRGGDYYYLLDDFMSANYREYADPTIKRSYIGFRLATFTNPLAYSQFIKISDINNSYDTTGYGTVSYEYYIGKYEITNSEYCEFLNAIASTDTYNLYDAGMNTSNRGGIIRSGSSGSYTYSLKTDMANKPVNFVNWFSAARMSNWLHNGKPSGMQNSSTTETGAYSINGATSGIFSKQPGALYWIPSEDEWYKAAYYKSNGLDAGYWDYATQSNTVPSCVTADSNGNGV